ncbi:MAG: NUDIX domain-containing protein [Prolixibacteraceae bacterium]|nr:NUDIX domain-containing protein [Prolixibacteraceae bacterium]
MYKVFFNDSTILISSEIKKSFKNNIPDDFNFEGYGIVNQIICEIESGRGNIIYNLCHPKTDRLWKYFRKRFVEIPAAGGLVQNKDGKLLFIKRLGVWDLPKGKIEKGESDQSAAVREVEEECGLSGVRILSQLDSTFHIYHSPYLPDSDNLVLKETKWFLMEYTGSEEPVPQMEENIEEVCWFDRSELPIVLANTYHSLRDLLKSLVI